MEKSFRNVFLKSKITKKLNKKIKTPSRLSETVFFFIKDCYLDLYSILSSKRLLKASTNVSSKEVFDIEVDTSAFNVSL